MARWFRWSLSVADPFGCRCLSISTILRFHSPPHRTGLADFPHPALRLASLISTQHAALISVVTPKAALSSRMNKVPSVTAESLNGVDRQSQSPDSWSLPVTRQKSGPFPPPELPGISGSTSLSAVLSVTTFWTFRARTRHLGSTAVESGIFR